MTLSPVFRSESAVRLLAEQGIWQRLAPAIEAQANAVRAIHGDLDAILDAGYRSPDGAVPESGNYLDERWLEFLQDYFFLILFRSLFESLGVESKRLPFYSELNFCIKGIITAADNLFDDQDKCLLPLIGGRGARYRSILQMMCFERIERRVWARAEQSGAIDIQRAELAKRGLLDTFARIGMLEGSEEGGVAEIPPPETMIDRVHRVRGGMLFGLSFVAPKAIETGDILRKIAAAEPAVARLGAAFQIVDDLTDFEFDLSRKSHNLLASQIEHHGSLEERKIFGCLWNEEMEAEPGLVEGLFRESARVVLDYAKREANASFETLHDLGFWFPPQFSNEVVHAIVGMDGVERMESIAAQ